MAKKLTAEQEAARDERRARFRALVSKIGKMTDEERNALARKMVGVLTVEQRSLSPTNTMLLCMQMPGATVVGGFRQWLKHGRAVMKGQHGASIWVPIGRKDKDGELEEKTGFICGTVFDISQTQEIETASNEQLVEHAGNIQPGLQLEAA